MRTIWFKRFAVPTYKRSKNPSCDESTFYIAQLTTVYSYGLFTLPDSDTIPIPFRTASQMAKMYYRSGTANSKTVNSKFHLIRSFCEIFARFLSFHV